MHIAARFTLPVYLRLPVPAGLVPREEDLDRDVLPVPNPAPHLPISPLADALGQRNLLRERPLNEQRQPRSAPRRQRVLQVLPECAVSGRGGPQQVLRRIVRVRVLLALGA